MRRNEVGILTVARCLSEGVGVGVKGFVVTASGLHEIHSFIGYPGRLQVVLAPWRRYGAIQVDVRLDTEVFLARHDLTGLTRDDVLPLSSRAASVQALSGGGRSLYGSTSTKETSMTCTGVVVPKQVESRNLASYWQG